MKVNPELEPPTAPSLSTHSVVEAELAIVRSINSHLRSMEKAAKEVCAAICLYQFSCDNGGEGLFSDWIFLAARCGALSIRDFGVSMAKVRGLIGQVQVYKDAFNVKSQKEAELEFKAYFPFCDKMRHSAAHPEVYNDPNKNIPFEGDYVGTTIRLEGVSQMSISSLFDGDTYIATFDGAIVNYSLDMATIKTINAVTQKFFGSFVETL